MIRCVDVAWRRFCRDKREVIIRTFRSIDASLTIDGASDGELSNKGLPTRHLMPALKDWKTRGAPTTGEGTMSTSGDTLEVSSSSDDELDDQVCRQHLMQLEVNLGYATCPPTARRAMRVGDVAMART